jgi:prepilin-type N-terminal cleavage/methylation domain-containing protein
VRPDGFTLVEILIVIAIVALLVAVGVPGLIHARIQANEVAALKDLRAAQSDQAGTAITCANTPGYLAGNKSGYVRGCAPGVYWARPEAQGRTGIRGFGADTAGRLCFTTDGSVPDMTGNCTLLR